MAEAPLSKSHARVNPEFPKLIELTNDFLLGEIWERPGFSPRGRSSLAALRREVLEALFQQVIGTLAHSRDRPELTK